MKLDEVIANARAAANGCGKLWGACFTSGTLRGAFVAALGLRDAGQDLVYIGQCDAGDGHGREFAAVALVRPSMEVN